jgi:hypothetical protein
MVLFFTIIGTGITQILVIFGLFLWSRTESNAYRKELNTEHKEMIRLFREMKDEMKNYHEKSLLIQDPFSKVREKKKGF